MGHLAKFPRNAAFLVCSVALAGCAGAPIDELLASTSIVADPRLPSRDDSPARLVISFHGDVKRLDFGEKFTLRLYKALSGERLPYAMLMYTWSSDAPVGTIAPNNRPLLPECACREFSGIQEKDR